MSKAEIEEMFLECPVTARYVKADVPYFILKTVARYFDFTITDITSVPRKYVAKARAYAVYFIWKYTRLHQRDIVKYFKGKSEGGFKNRTLVVHARKRVMSEMKTYPDIKDEFMALTALIESVIYS